MEAHVTNPVTSKMLVEQCVHAMDAFDIRIGHAKVQSNPLNTIGVPLVGQHDARRVVGRLFGMIVNRIDRLLGR